MHVELSKTAASLTRRASASLVVSAALFGSAPAAAGQEPTWLREFGGSSDDGGGDLLRIEPGRILLSGTTSGSLFGGSQGFEDVFLAWFDDAGNVLSGVQFGTNSTDTGAGLAPATEGGVFAAGSTQGSFGAPNAGGWDAWVARCSSAGNRLWVRQLGSSEWDFGGLVATDGVGGVFTAGETLGDLGGPSAGPFDIWIARYDQEGTRLWLRQFGTSASDYPTDIAPDGRGGFFLCGTTDGSLGGPLIGAPDAWIARFDDGGDQVWLRQIGTASWDTGRAMSPDGSAGVFFAGATNGVLAGSAPGGTWLARYDGLGNRLTIMQFASSPNGWPEAVCSDSLGGAFVSGSTTGSLGGPNAGGNDVWVAHVQGGTNVAWIDQFGSAAFDYPTSFAPAGPGSVFATGYTYGTFAPGGGGGDDAWLARYDTCYPDCNTDGVLTVADFGCFQTRFMTADLYADCNADGLLTVQDFGCFQTKFVVGCP